MARPGRAAPDRSAVAPVAAAGLSFSDEDKLGDRIDGLGLGPPRDSAFPSRRPQPRRPRSLAELFRRRKSWPRDYNYYTKRKNEKTSDGGDDCNSTVVSDF